MSFPLPYFFVPYTTDSNAYGGQSRVPEFQAGSPRGTQRTTEVHTSPSVAKSACHTIQRLEIHADQGATRRYTIVAKAAQLEVHADKRWYNRGLQDQDAAQQLPLGGWCDDYPGDRLLVLMAKCLAVLMAHPLAYRC